MAAGAGSINSSILNLGGADPIQGYDVGVWVYDVGRGAQVLLGQFTSIVVTVRNATEPYIEFGQRYPRYLDGEMQIAYVMEKGLLDINVFQETMGYKHFSRSKRFGRSPRFDITFTADPVDAAAMETDNIGTSLDRSVAWPRDVTGRFILHYCKMDSWHVASTAGRQVVATQWQGVAEGFSAVPGDFSTSKDLAAPEYSVGAGAPALNGAFFQKSGIAMPDAIATTDPQRQGFGPDTPPPA